MPRRSLNCRFQAKLLHVYSADVKDLLPNLQKESNCRLKSEILEFRMHCSFSKSKYMQNVNADVRSYYNTRVTIHVATGFRKIRLNFGAFAKFNHFERQHAAHNIPRYSHTVATPRHRHTTRVLGTITVNVKQLSQTTQTTNSFTTTTTRTYFAIDGHLMSQIIHDLLNFARVLCRSQRRTAACQSYRRRTPGASRFVRRHLRERRSLVFLLVSKEK